MDELTEIVIKWDKSYATGIESIDNQHQVLIEMIAKFQRGMLLGRTRDELPGLLDRLITYAKYHFQWEEQMLEAHQYPDLEAHRKVHKVLIDRIMDFKERQEAGNVVPGATVMLFLRHWFTDHILETDFQYARHLKETGALADQSQPR